MRVRAALAGAAALVSALGGGAGAAAPAFAHGESTPTIRTQIDRIEPAVPGLKVEVRRGQAAALAAENRTGRDLEVIGDAGEPFLRIGPRGAEANVNSATWYRSGNPDGIGKPPADARIGASPRWERVSAEPQFTWFDHRLHPGEIAVPPEARGGRRTVRLDQWTVPLRLGGRPARLLGHVDFQPILGAVVPEISSSPAPLPGVFVALLRGRVPGVYLSSSASERVTVLGRAGEPFARIGSRGAEVNLRSPTHAADQLARGEPLRTPTNASAPPRWRRVSSETSYVWLDPRALYPRDAPPADIVRRDRRAEVGRFSIPLRSGGEAAEVSGTLTYIPSPTGNGPAGRPVGERDEEAGAPVGWLAALALLVAAGVGGGALLRRRRSRGASAAPAPGTGSTTNASSATGASQRTDEGVTSTRE